MAWPLMDVETLAGRLLPRNPFKNSPCEAFFK